MLRSLVLTSDNIDELRLTAQRTPLKECGAVVTFAGVVRGTEAETDIAAREYEAFREMAEHQFAVLFDTIESRWPIASLTVVHRLGTVVAGEISLWVQVTAPHRHEAFAACEFLIGEMKKVVPIWKKPRKAFPA